MNTLIRGARSARFVVFLLFCGAIFVHRSAEAQAKLSVSPTLVRVQTIERTNAPSQTVKISNAGKGSMKWSVVDLTTGWLKVSPTGGVNNGTLTLTFETSGLQQSTYQGSFRVTSNGGNIPVTVEVTILPPAALTVTCPSNVSVASPDGSPVVVTYTVTTSGGVAPVTVTGSPASGSSFAVGTTPVSVIAQSSDKQEKSCGFTVTVTYSPGSSPSGVGPQPAIACPTGAIDIWPGDIIQNIVNTYGASTSFCLRAGIHYQNGPVTPKTGNTFVGEYGAILDATGWTTTDDTLAAFRAHNQDIDNVTIRNLVIRNFRRGIHAFGDSLPDHWTIENNEITSNYSGIVFPSYSMIRNNYIHHNQFSGYMAALSHYSTVENNEIAYNGWEQKVGQSTNVTFRNNFLHHNAGGGIWFDYDNTGALIEGNRVEDNGWIGIFYEVSSNGIIRNNTIRRNAEAGVFIGTSKATQIHHNTLDNNFRGITYFVNCTSIGGGTISFDLANITAHDNTIIVGTQSGAFASIFSHTNCTAQQLAAYQNGSKNLTFSHNSYDVPSPSTGAYWFWNGYQTWSEWQQRGQDVDSVVQ